MVRDHMTVAGVDPGLLQAAGAVLVAVGLHFAVEAALGRVHGVPGTSPVSRTYGAAAAVLFLVVGGALVREGRLVDGRLEWAVAGLSLLVLAVVALAYAS